MKKSLMAKIMSKCKILCKKGAASVRTMVVGVVTAIIGFIVVFRVVGGSAADLNSAAANISGSGLPLVSLMGQNSVLLTIFVIAVFLALMSLAFDMYKGK